MSKITIYEGPNKSGKTTLCKEETDMQFSYIGSFDKQVYKALNSLHKKTTYYDRRQLTQVTTRDLDIFKSKISTVKEFMPADTHIGIDRSIISSFVYPRVRYSISKGYLETGRYNYNPSLADDLDSITELIEHMSVHVKFFTKSRVAKPSQGLRFEEALYEIIYKELSLCEEVSQKVARAT